MVNSPMLCIGSWSPEYTPGVNTRYLILNFAAMIWNNQIYLRLKRDFEIKNIYVTSISYIYRILIDHTMKSHKEKFILTERYSNC
jgi:hypothetical protein